MSKSLLSATLAILSLLAAVPTSARAEDKAGKADKDERPTCTISVKKGDLFAQGKDLIVEGKDAVRDAVAIDGDVVVRAGTSVNDVVSLRGKVTVESGARVAGDVSAIGGDVHIHKGATIAGDVSAIGGQIQADEGASIAGDKNELSLNINGENLFRNLVGHIFSGKGTTHCQVRLSEN
ncbi:polymer-forming cytoskeletal protein [Archangium minus]|uniref:Polymer-forming cytoskeletal protein n=1 Tax=Archangium minus TaxID=83450 RepID=A0ABY9WX68_9BACT|nr:polymer-forming cytoskeletal protein [Archangium minus]